MRNWRWPEHLEAPQAIAIAAGGALGFATQLVVIGAPDERLEAILIVQKIIDGLQAGNILVQQRVTAAQLLRNAANFGKMLCIRGVRLLHIDKAGEERRYRIANHLGPLDQMILFAGHMAGA